MAALKSKMKWCATATIFIVLSSVRAEPCMGSKGPTSCVAGEVSNSQAEPGLDELGSLLQTFGQKRSVEHRVTELHSGSSSSAVSPPEVPGDGFKVLQSVDRELQMCSRSSGAVNKATNEEPSFLSNDHDADVQRAKHRKAFVCAAGCSAREPQLERSLAPWADWQANFSGLDMLKTFQAFCEAPSTKEKGEAFVITALWKGDAYFKACGVPDVWNASLYLIGPEDLSLATVFLLGILRVSTLPPGPIAFGMYLSDYTSLVDHFITGPGLPMFTYLGRHTSWAIPWPSSFTVFSTYEVEKLREAGIMHSSFSKGGTPVQKLSDSVMGQHPWESRTPKAYWIGTVTGPWDFQMDAGVQAVPRVKLLRLSKEHPQELMAEWSGVAGYGVSWIDYLNDNVSGFPAQQSRNIEEITGIPKSDYKPVQEWMDYKYFVNLDGVVMGGRLNKLLALGGVVLQHESGYTEYVDALMKPYEHYVPISYDLSDLTAKVKWLQQNDAEARRIAENGKKLANQRMRLEDHICYMWRALEALGAKLASADVNAAAVEKHLRDQQFKRATIQGGGMRATLESFWGTRLEWVHTGQREMARSAIPKLQWLWDRFEKLHADSQAA